MGQREGHHRRQRARLGVLDRRDLRRVPRRAQIVGRLDDDRVGVHARGRASRDKEARRAHVREVHVRGERLHVERSLVRQHAARVIPRLAGHEQSFRAEATRDIDRHQEHLVRRRSRHGEGVRPHRQPAVLVRHELVLDPPDESGRAGGVRREAGRQGGPRAGRDGLARELRLAHVRHQSHRVEGDGVVQRASGWNAPERVHAQVASRRGGDRKFGRLASGHDAAAWLRSVGEHFRQAGGLIRHGPARRLEFRRQRPRHRDRSGGAVDPGAMDRAGARVRAGLPDVPAALALVGGDDAFGLDQGRAVALLGHVDRGRDERAFGHVEAEVLRIEGVDRVRAQVDAAAEEAVDIGRRDESDAAVRCVEVLQLDEFTGGIAAVGASHKTPVRRAQSGPHQIDRQDSLGRRWFAARPLVVAQFRVPAEVAFGAKHRKLVALRQGCAAGTARIPEHDPGVLPGALERFAADVVSEVPHAEVDAVQLGLPHAPGLVGDCEHLDVRLGVARGHRVSGGRRGEQGGGRKQAREERRTDVLGHLSGSHEAPARNWNGTTS